jgi:hypothetical protein
MSLVGSLEDLGLGDILQIIGLSRKSGVLSLRSDSGDGCLVFRDGLVRAAQIQGDVADLGALLVSEGALDPDALEAARAESREKGTSLEDVLAARAGLERADLDERKRAHVERVLMRFFGWRRGEFSFDVGETGREADPSLVVVPGLNAQFLALTATTSQDEAARDEGGSRGADLDDDTLSGDVAPIELGDDDVAEPEFLDAEIAEVDLASVDLAEVDYVPDEKPPDELEDTAVFQARERRLAAAAAAEAAGGAASTAAVEAPPVVVIDAELALLEWARQALSSEFPSVHCFQRPDQAIARLRHYLSRSELPIVVVSGDLVTDAASRSRDAVQSLARLKSQVPRLPVLMLVRDREASLPPGAPACDVRLARPDLRREPPSPEQTQALCDALVALTRHMRRPGGAAGAAVERTSPLRRLRDATTALRTRASQGEVLGGVMEFAGEHFGRVALFLVCGEEIVGMAQQRLGRAGGPDDAGIRGVRMPVAESAWLRRACTERRAFAAAPEDAGDRRLARSLGTELPEQAFLGPVESQGQVVALLYGDDLPAKRPVVDPTAVEVLLQQAGLTLDRAVLERALARDGEPRDH